jgi:hypothetical protein
MTGYRRHAVESALGLDGMAVKSPTARVLKCSLDLPQTFVLTS